MVRLVEEGKEQKTLDMASTASLFNLIETSKKKDQQYFRFCNMMRNLLKGDHWKDLKMSARGKEKTKMVINLAHAHARTLLPTIFFQQPTLRALPKLPLHEPKAPTWTAVGNNTMEPIGFGKVMKEIALDAITFPEGVFKWVVNVPGGGKANQQREMAEDGSRGPVEWLTLGAPAPVRLSPPQLIVDYLSPSRDLESARFIAIQYTKTVAELKAHPIYGKHIPKGFKAHTSAGMHGHTKKRFDPFKAYVESETNFHTSTVDDMVIIYEVWIHQLVEDPANDEEGSLRCYQQMCTLMEGHDLPIRPLTPWAELLGEGVTKYPVHRVVLNPIPDDIPVSELGVQQQIQVGINWLTSRIISIVEQDKLIREVDTSKLKNASKAKKQLASGKTIEDIEVNDLGAFAMVQPTFVGRDNYQMLNILNGYLQQVSGFGQNRRGGTGARTATEASLIEDGVQIKTDEKVDTMRQFLKAVCKQMLQIIWAMVKTDPDGMEYIYRVAGEAGQIQWLKFDNAELEWMPDIEIEVDSFRARDQQKELQKALQAYQIGAQAKMAGENIRTDILLRQVFEALGIEDIGKIIFSQQDEMLEQSMELVYLGLGMHDQVNVDEDDNHAIHLQTIQAFMNSPVFMILPPEGKDAVQVHASEHERALQIQQEVAQQALGAGQNPFGSVGAPAPVDTPANNARQETQQDRLSLGVPGAAGQQSI